MQPVAEPMSKIEAVSNKTEASPHEASPHKASSEPRPVAEPVFLAEVAPVLESAPPGAMRDQGATSEVCMCA